MATPSDVAWETLSAGDTVRIHWRQDPYRNKWVICRQGTASDPITVIGVPGPNGERPVIDGNGATTRLILNYWNEPRGVIKIGGASFPADTMPRHIIIEGLEIRSGRPPYNFTDDTGNIQNYPNNAAAIYLEKGEDITIRNCSLHDCGNGLFTASSSSRILVEGNHLYDNGNTGSIYEHNSYTEASGITFQYNHYGSLRAGASGNNLKDRSAGTVIRYNWIEGGNRQLDLVDTGNNTLQQDPAYRETFVYGNVLIEPDDSGNRQIIHYGGDSSGDGSYRKGTLYLHHNTIISTRAGRSTLLRLSTNDESADCRNNVIFVTASGNQLELLSNTGTLTMTNNWLKPGWTSSFQSGYLGTITGTASNVEGNAPAFIDLSTRNFRLNTGSPAIDAGAVLHPETSVDHSPTRELRKFQKNEVRRTHSALDLGAFEYSPYAVWQTEEFGADAENQNISGENADPDGDLIPNLLEFAFMRDPLNPSSTALLRPTWVTIEAKQYFAIEFQQRPSPTGLAFLIESSDDLNAWQPGSVFTDTQSPSLTQHTADASSDGVTRIRQTTSSKTESGGFLRLKIAYE